MCLWYFYLKNKINAIWFDNVSNAILFGAIGVSQCYSQNMMYDWASKIVNKSCNIQYNWICAASPHSPFQMWCAEELFHACTICITGPRQLQPVPDRHWRHPAQSAFHAQSTPCSVSDHPAAAVAPSSTGTASATNLSATPTNFPAILQNHPTNPQPDAF